MELRFRIAAFFAAIFLAQPSFAGLYFEPYAGYESSDTKTKIVASDGLGTTYTIEGDGSLKGLVYGGKIGLTFGPLVIGGDYQKGSIKDKDGDNVNVDDYGPFLAIVGQTVKLSATYFAKSTAGDPSSYTSGAGYKVGIGVRASTYASLNVDYMDIKWDEYKDKNLPLTIDSCNVTRQGIFVSLSFPFGR